MSIALSKSIAAYFAAEQRSDADALANCFAADGVVRDEGRTYAGVAAIRQWNAEAKQKYHHTVAPVDAFERDGKTVVIGKVSGDFPDHHGLAIPLERIDRRNGMVIFLLGLCVPLPNGGDTCIRPAFISHDAICGKAVRQSIRVRSLLGSEIGGNRFG